MSYRNQTKSSENKKENIEEIPPLDKRRKIGTGKMPPPASGTRGTARQAFAVVNAGGDPPSDANSECSSVVFTREDVDALLNEKIKVKNKFDYKGKCENMTEYIKKLKACIKWFQELEQSLVLEQEKLKSALESAEKKCVELEGQMRKKEEEMNAVIAELNGKYDSLKEEFSKENAEKMAVIHSHKKETDARVAAEKLQASLSEELQKAHQEALSTSNKMKALEDEKKRLQEYNTSLQQYNSSLQADAAAATETISKLQKEKSAIMENLSSLRGHNALLQEQITSLRASQHEAIKQKEVLTNEVSCLRGELQQARDDRDLQVAQVQALKAEIVKFNEFSGKSAAELEIQTTRTKSLEEICSSQKERITILEHQLEVANEKLKMSDLTASERKTESEEQKKELRDVKNRLADAEMQLVEAEKLRKKLLNTILELKGNIRVFCRVRPLLPDDDCGGTEMSVVSYPTSTELLGRGIELLQSGQKYPFSFDKVFNHDASQEDVFVEISQLVQSALDGYKVCIFAYGQTGSGKTYTMMGRPEALEQKGLIPRSLEQIFETSQSLLSQGWKFKMQASMLEIYNETIRDLLCPNRSGTDNGLLGKQYTIKHDANGNTHVSDLTIVDVCSIREVSSLLHQAAQSRSVGKTQMNEQSSRSHFVFTLRISGVNLVFSPDFDVAFIVRMHGGKSLIPENIVTFKEINTEQPNNNTEQQVQGVLNLIDLAGSERLSRSGATGDRLKETQAINKSLSCLSDVIFAIAKKEDHVPFRNSKLTYLLQPCLGGDSKTLMFVNISPEPASTNESLCSLRFAARVNACEIGVARRQTYVRSSDSRLSYG